MRLAKKGLGLLLTLILAITLIGVQNVSADNAAVPDFTVKAVSKGTAAKVTIKKTAGAAGFEVYAYGKNIDDTPYNGDVDTSFGHVAEKVADIPKDGTAERTVTIKSLPAGTYKIRVRSYDESHILSEFSAEKTVKIKAAANGYKKKYDFSKVKAGDIIKFGSFEQDNDFTNGKEPIEWVVLAKGKKTMLVISKNTLTNLPYNTERKEITWENCTLRKWLNESFYTNAFNKQEKKKIKATTIENQDNPKYGIEGGKDTKDKIFLPSYDEMTQYGFDTGAGSYDQKRRATPTAYAIAKGAAPSDVYPTLEGAPAYAYWLRTIGGTSEGDYAAYVNREGEDYAFGNVVDIRYGVRPMMYISIK